MNPTTIPPWHPSEDIPEERVRATLTFDGTPKRGDHIVLNLITSGHRNRIVRLWQNLRRRYVIDYTVKFTAPQLIVRDLADLINARNIGYAAVARDSMIEIRRCG